MEFAELLRRRRMCRSFTTEPIEEAVLDRVVAAGLRAPSAGNARGLDLVVLVGDEVREYFEMTLPPERRRGFRFGELVHAAALILLYADPAAYAQRYSAPDKAHSGLDEPDRWQTPYWHVDGGQAAMLLQLAAIDEGLGVLFFGLFAQANAVAAAYGIPAGREPIGALAIGHPAEFDPPGRSADRPARAAHEQVHRGRW